MRPVRGRWVVTIPRIAATLAEVMQASQGNGQPHTRGETAMATTTRTRPAASTARTARTSRNGNGDAAPHYARLGKEVHPFGTVLDLPIELAASARKESCELLNGILADSLILYALYKKHHWNVVGPTFYQLHLLFDKHAEEQQELIGEVAERAQMLGGIAVGDPRHAAELTTVPRAPDGAEDVRSEERRVGEEGRAGGGTERG